MKKSLCKIFIFIVCFIFIDMANASALEASFKQTSYIDGIIQHRMDTDGIVYYQKARFIERDDGVFAYCIEPFSTLDENITYKGEVKIDSISEEKWKEIYLTAYYGYGYENHTDPKWYAITQLMIWQIAQPSAKMYFADYPLGEDNHQFDSEMNEIKMLVYNHDNKPFFNNTTTTILKGDTIVLNDTKNALSKFKLKKDYSNILEINNNELRITATKKGRENITFIYQDNKYQVPPLFYHDPISQDIIVVGDFYPVEATLSLYVVTGIIIVYKEGEEAFPVDGTVIELYDSNHQKISEQTISGNNYITFSNLGKGKYYIKEKESSLGYELSEEEFEVEITRSTLKQEVTIKNKVITNKIEIYKEYGTTDNLVKEANITFKIYGYDGALYDEITTDEFGYASIILPFGIYTFHQVNTTDGFETVDDFIVEVNNKSQKIQTYNLINKKIEVPNTHLDVVDNSKINNTIIKEVYYDDKKKSYFYNFNINF